MSTGGIVLCGGRSSRMGTSKALLPFGGEVLLQCVVRVLLGEVRPVVVVAARGQDLPDLPDGVVVAWDEYEAMGPLAGLATGLAALRECREPAGGSGPVDLAYATATDVPLLRPEFLRQIVRRLEEAPEADLAIVRQGRFYHPLAAAYRCSLEPAIRNLLSDGQLRPVSLVASARAVEIDVEELTAVDPDLESLLNCNTPEEYAAVIDRSRRTGRLPA